MTMFNKNFGKPKVPSLQDQIENQKTQDFLKEYDELTKKYKRCFIPPQFSLQIAKINDDNPLPASNDPNAK